MNGGRDGLPCDFQQHIGDNARRNQKHRRGQNDPCEQIFPFHRVKGFAVSVIIQLNKGHQHSDTHRRKHLKFKTAAHKSRQQKKAGVSSTRNSAYRKEYFFFFQANLHFFFRHWYLPVKSLIDSRTRDRKRCTMIILSHFDRSFKAHHTFMESFATTTL